VPESVYFQESLLQTHLPVDVRTPLEYNEDHIPGAINAPLLSNDERVEIGTIHRISGPHAARVRGLDLVSHRIPSMVAAIAEAASGRPLLVYCWRGGLRSRTVTSILELTGYEALQLRGGYKSFRHHVMEFFSPFSPPGPLVVIHGMTGIGKTAFLLGLKSNLFTVIDLEGLSCHRGSAFGELGLTQGLTQKRFETLLWESFRVSPPGKPIIVEGESKRIGRISLPGDMYEVMLRSPKVWCEASLETRVRRLIEEYGRPDYREGMEAALNRISKRLRPDKFNEIEGYLKRWELEPFAEELIRHYYDKVYYKGRDWREDAVIPLEDYHLAGQELERFITENLTDGLQGRPC
jgi:tRNA 2-selenouridine synthase